MSDEKVQDLIDYINGLDDQAKIHVNAQIALSLNAYGDPVSAFVKYDDWIPLFKLKTLVSKLENLEAALRDARAVLEYYAEEANWTRTAIHEGDMSSETARKWLDDNPLEEK